MNQKIILLNHKSQLVCICKLLNNFSKINSYYFFFLDNSQEESSNSSATGDFVFFNTLIGK